MDWYEWHEGYEESPALKRRLEKVGEHIAGALDGMAPGAIPILSICAGDGRALELDPRLVHQGRALARTAGVQQQVQFAHLDATRSDAYDGRVPSQLTLACGVLGNIAPENTASFITLASAVCAPGGTLIWTRLLSANNGASHTTVIRRLLDANDGPSEHFTRTFGAGRFVVASYIQRGTPGPLPHGEIFKFVGFQTLLKEPESPSS